MTYQAVQEEIDRSIEPVLARYDGQLARQQALVDRLRFLSPAIAVHEALNDVAGTGLARHKHFLAQVGAYHRSRQATAGTSASWLRRSRPRAPRPRSTSGPRRWRTPGPGTTFSASACTSSTSRRTTSAKFLAARPA